MNPPTLPSRWSALLDAPELQRAPALRATLDALINASTPLGFDGDGWPRWSTLDHRTGTKVTWGITGLRPNGLTGWFDAGGHRRSDWRIDFNGRLHRGQPWMRALAAPGRTVVEDLRKALTQLTYAAEHGSPELLAAATTEARAALSRAQEVR